MRVTDQPRLKPALETAVDADSAFDWCVDTPGEQRLCKKWFETIPNFRCPTTDEEIEQEMLQDGGLTLAHCENDKWASCFGVITSRRLLCRCIVCPNPTLPLSDNLTSWPKNPSITNRQKYVEQKQCLVRSVAVPAMSFAVMQIGMALYSPLAFYGRGAQGVAESIAQVTDCVIMTVECDVSNSHVGVPRVRRAWCAAGVRTHVARIVTLTFSQSLIC